MSTRIRRIATTIRTGLTASVAMTVLAATTAAAQAPQHGGTKSPADLGTLLRDWPKAAQDAAMFMTKKYGAPAATTPDLLVWNQTGPWKRTVIYRHEFPHEFPMHHTDVMQQWVDYKAPPASYDDLAMYDGSVVLERTSGEISARCDKEGANFLALNLADEIAHGKRSVADARKIYGEQIMAMKAMKPAPYTERLMFGAQRATNDPDHPVTNDAQTSARQ